MEVKTTREMMEELELLTHAVSGLSSAVREKVLSDAASAKSTSPVPSAMEFRKLTPGEKKLRRVKVEARRQQEEREALKVEELRSRSLASNAMRSSGGRSSITASPKATSRQVLSQEFEADNQGSGQTRVKSPPTDKKELQGFPTALKRNITSRRSRDRSDNISGKQPNDLTSKRPKERAKDKQYERMSGNWQDLEIPSREVTRSPGPTAQRTPKPSEPVPPFLKRDILALKAYPEVHEQLMEIYSERLTYEEQLQEAKYDHDEPLVKFYQDLCNSSNVQMHDIHRGHISRLNMMPRQGYMATPTSGLGGGRIFSSEHQRRTPDGDPKSIFAQDKRSGSSLSRKHPGMDSTHSKGQWECPPHQHQFNIWLVHNDNETQMGIWDTMPLQLIFAYAHEWVNQDLGADISEDMMRLVLESNTMLANTGYVFEVPILANQSIDIQEETGFFDSQIKRTTTPQKPKPHREVNRAAFIPLKPRSPPGVEITQDPLIATCPLNYSVETNRRGHKLRYSM